MTDTMAPTAWNASCDATSLRTPNRRSRRGFAIGLAIAAPLSLAAWYAVLSLL